MSCKEKIEYENPKEIAWHTKQTAENCRGNGKMSWQQAVSLT